MISKHSTIPAPDSLKISFTFYFWHKFFILDDVKIAELSNNSFEWKNVTVWPPTPIIYDKWVGWPVGGSFDHLSGQRAQPLTDVFTEHLVWPVKVKHERLQRFQFPQHVFGCRAAVPARSVAPTPVINPLRR